MILLNHTDLWLNTFPPKITYYYCFCFLFFSAMLISVLSIIATEFVYACVPKLRNLNGKCLMCYLASLAIGYTLVSLLQLNGINHIEPMLCYSVAHLIYFSLLSAFLWLNVVNFDLWQSFQ